MNAQQRREPPGLIVEKSVRLNADTPEASVGTGRPETRSPTISVANQIANDLRRAHFRVAAP